jgi:RNA polymerase sigma-70 factor (ECF subfamily)
MMPEGLLKHWEDARLSWPGVVVSPDEFADYVQTHSQAVDAAQPSSAARSSDESDEQTAKNLHFVDLYLACACARGDVAALGAFDGAFLGEVDAAARRLGSGGPSVEELRQAVRQRLFVAAPPSRPKIAEYSGWGELRAWVRIVATRTALNAMSRVRREVSFDQDAFAFIATTDDDPELAYMKQFYADAFRLAFREAFEGLESRERNLLRYAFSERLTVDAIGEVYGVHRATAARWVVASHESLAGRLRSALVRRLGIHHEDYESIVRLVRSRLDITLERYLHADPG